MTFNEALSATFNDGDRVTRQHWNNRRIYLAVVDYNLCIHNFYSGPGKDDGLPHPYTLQENDYFATDWEVVVDG